MFKQGVRKQNQSLSLDEEKSNETAETLRERIKELAMLNEIGRAISSAINIDELIERIYDQTTRIMPVSAFYIALYHPQKNELRVLFDVLDGKRQKSEETTRNFGNGRTEYIIRNQQPLLIKSKPAETYRKLGIVTGDKKAKACVGVPLINAGKAIGALVVQSYSYDHAYDEGHIDLLSTIANQAAIAIENARLFERIQEELQERKKIEERLQQRNADLIIAKKDTDNILNNVKDGLFLLDQNYTIAPQYSAALEAIFEQKALAGFQILDYLNKKIEDNKIQACEDYLKLIFDATIEETVLEDLNPLSEIKLQFKKTQSGIHYKYLTFNFRRIQNAGVVKEVIVSVNDITQQIELANNLEKSREESKRQMEWLFAILNVDGQMLDEFMHSADEELSLIDEICKENRLSKSIDEVYRSVHSIKGNASMLELEFITINAHTIEESLSKIREQKKLDKQTIDALTIELNKLREVFKEIGGLIERLQQFHTRFRPTRKHDIEILFNSISKLIKNLSAQSGKEITLDYSHYDASILPHQHRLLIRDILVQLTRNSVYHGIESADERLTKNKSRKGTILISNALENNKFVFIYKDDGRGIQINELRMSALKTGQWKETEIENWSEKRQAELIFLPGISTAEKANLTAGRGMGMNIIKNKIEKIGGAIEINSEPDRYTEFKICFPANAVK